MASVKAFIRTSAKKAETVKVRFRVTDGRNIQLFHKSEIEINPDLFDKNNEIVKAKVIYPKEQRTKFNNDVANRKALIRSIYDNETGLTSELLNIKIDQSLHPEKYISDEGVEIPKTYFQFFDQFLNQHKVSEGRRAHFNVLKRALQRYELYRQITLHIDLVTKETIRDIENFLKDEPDVFKNHPEIYKLIPESRTPQLRGINTVSGILSRFRTFCLWLVDTEKTINNPFKKYSIDAEKYGTPFYLTIDERNTLYKFDLSDRPDLAIQRDIFIFQCLIGCRIGDLYSLKPSSIIDGCVEYIAKKTKDEDPETIYVPLNDKAKEILSRYPAKEGERLFPFIAEQNYNYNIKDMFAVAGLTRIVTIINSATRKEEKKPLNEVASSHLARRTFIGNLYKQVQDPNLVGSMTGHVQGSKSFARYRTIDLDMKKNLINLLD